MTVGTAARNNSPSWLTISTDYAKAPDNARQISSPENLKCTPTLADYFCPFLSKQRSDFIASDPVSRKRIKAVDSYLQAGDGSSLKIRPPDSNMQGRCAPKNLCGIVGPWSACWGETERARMNRATAPAAPFRTGPNWICRASLFFLASLLQGAMDARVSRCGLSRL